MPETLGQVRGKTIEGQIVGTPQAPDLNIPSAAYQAMPRLNDATISSIPSRNPLEAFGHALTGAGARVSGDFLEGGQNLANSLGIPASKPIDFKELFTGKGALQLGKNLLRSGVEMVPGIAAAPISLGAGVASALGALAPTGGIRSLKDFREALAPSAQLLPIGGNVLSEILRAGDVKKGITSYGKNALQNPAGALLDLHGSARSAKSAARQGVSLAAPKLYDGAAKAYEASSNLEVRGRQNLQTPITFSPSMGAVGGGGVRGGGSRAVGAGQVALGRVGRSLSGAAWNAIRANEKSKGSAFNERGQVGRNPTPEGGYGAQTVERFGPGALDLRNRWEDGKSPQFAIPGKNPASEIFPLEAWFKNGIINPDNILNAGPELWDGEAAGMQVRDPLTGGPLSMRGPRGGAPRPLLGQGGPLGPQSAANQAYSESRGDGLVPGIVGYTKQQIATSLNQAMRDNAPIRLIVAGTEEMVRGNYLYTTVFRNATEALIAQGRSSEDAVVGAARQAVMRTQREMLKKYETAMGNYKGGGDAPRPSKILAFDPDRITSLDDVFGAPWEAMGFGSRNEFFKYLGSDANAKAGIVPNHLSVARGIQDPRFRGQGGLVVAASRLAIPEQYQGLQNKGDLAKAAADLTFETGKDGIPGHRTYQYGALADAAGILPKGVYRDELWTDPRLKNFFSFFGSRPLLNATPEFLEWLYDLPAGELSGGRYYGGFDESGGLPNTTLGGDGGRSSAGVGALRGGNPEGLDPRAGSDIASQLPLGNPQRGATGADQLSGGSGVGLLRPVGEAGGADAGAATGLPANALDAPGAARSALPNDPVPGAVDPLKGFDLAANMYALGGADPKLFKVIRDVLASQNKDFNFLHRFASPLSVRDGRGNTLIPGSYERIAGPLGKQLSDIFRDLQFAVNEGEMGKGRALRETQNRLDYLTPALEADGFPGLVEEAKRHLQEIENDFYRQAAKRANDKSLTQDQRDAASSQAAGFSLKVKPYEKALGTVVMAAGEAMGKNIPDPDLALRRTVDRVAEVNSILKLKYNIKSSAVNLTQPYETLWPRVSSADFARIVAQSLDPRELKRLQEAGVLDGPTKLEGDLSRGGGFADPELTDLIKQDQELMDLANLVESDFAVREAAGEVDASAFEKPGPKRVPMTTKEKIQNFSPFGSASGQNRAIGYLYGELDARRKGMVDPAEIHKNGLAWAEVVEFDNSIYNTPPIMRDAMARLLLQYKGFTVKSIENLADLISSAKTPQERAARLAKWAGQKAVVGGAKALSGPASAAAVAIYFAAKERAKEKGMSEDEAEKLAQTLYFGAPAMLGMDLSSSVTMLDEPFGNTTSEQAVNFLAGPTLGSAITLEQMRRDGKPLIDMAGRISPYVRQGRSALGLGADLLGQRPPDLFGMLKEKDRSEGGAEFGTRPATRGESVLKSMAVPLATSGAAGANLDEVKKLKSRLTDLYMERSFLEYPERKDRSESQIKKMRWQKERLAGKKDTRQELLQKIAEVEAEIKRLKALTGPIGLGRLPAPPPLVVGG